MSIKVYRYGLLAPILNADLVKQQIYLAHKYRNLRVEIEIARRKVIAELESNYDDIRDLELQLESVKNENESAKKALIKSHLETRSRYNPLDLKNQVKLTKTKIKTIQDELRIKRKLHREDEDLKSKKEEVNERVTLFKNLVRGNSGLYWGTYQLVDDAAETANKIPMYDKKGLSLPHFVRWNGNGHIGIQIQGGMSAKDIFQNNNTLIKIDPINELAFYSEKRAERRKLSRSTLYFRIGSNEKREPIFAVFPIIMHRSLPQNGIIKRAVVSKNLIGSRESWSVEITIENPVDINKLKTNPVAIDVGWRQMENGIRIGKYGDGKEFVEILLSNDIISGIRKADDLKSIRDKNFDLIRNQLSEWIKINVLPDNLSLKFKYINQWKSIYKLIKAIKEWKNSRFDGDEEIFSLLEKWRYHDFHLWNFECNQRKKALGRRKEFYRCLAKELSTKYSHLILEDFDLKNVSSNLEIDSDKEDNKIARSNRHIAAISVMRNVLINAFGNNNVIKVNPAFSTKICNVCKYVEDVLPTEILHTCSKCFSVWDREDNAIRNLLARGCERVNDVEITGPARNEENDNKINNLTVSKRAQARQDGAKKRYAERAARKVAAKTAKS